MKPVRGAALLWVVWILLLGSSLIALALSTTATHQAYASLARRQSQADAALDAGIALAVWQLDSRSGLSERWLADGTVRSVAFSGYTLDIAIQDESAKIDLNQASVALLQSYFQTVGLSEAEAIALASAIQDYRDFDDASTWLAGKESDAFRANGYPVPPNRPFQTLEELLSIPGFSEDLLARTRNDLTVHSQRAIPHQLTASANVLAAVTAAGLTPPETTQRADFGLYRIQVRVKPKRGPASGVTAVLQLLPFDPTGRGYRMLSWNRTFAGVD